MIVRLTLSPDETIDPLELQDAANILTENGFHVDIIHAGRIYDSDEYERDLAKYSPPRAKLWRAEYERDHR